MNRGKTKQLKKALLTKTPEVLLLVKNNVKDTKDMTAEALWRTFKRLYKNDKVPKSLLNN